jgi:hypothetical protein
VRTYSKVGSSNCSSCGLHSFSLRPGATSCSECASNQYVAYTSLDGSSAECRSCPASAECQANGFITASAGSFLFIDEGSGSVLSASCSSLACLAGSACLASADSSVAFAPRIPVSDVPVLNCCGSNRVAASSNVLCAQCKDGYTEWSGVCVPCRHSNLLAIAITVGSALTLLYFLHRVPRSVASAQLGIFMYFAQMTWLVQTSGQQRALLEATALVNMDMLQDVSILDATRVESADHVPSTGEPLLGCLGPLRDWDKMALNFAMPALLLSGVAVIFAVQLACKRFLFLGGREESPRWTNSRAAYRALFIKVDQRIDDEEEFDEEDNSRSEHSTVDVATVVHAVVCSPVAPELPDVDENFGRLVPSAPVSSWSIGSRLPVWSVCGLSLYSYSRTALRVTLYSYNAATLLLLNYFRCQDLPDQLGSRMYTKPTIECQSVTYRLFLPVMVVGVIVVTAGMPLALTATLAWRRHNTFNALAETTRSTLWTNPFNHDPAAALSQATTTFKARFGLLYRPYRPQCWYWTAVVLLRRAVLITVYVFAPPTGMHSWLTACNFTILGSHLIYQPYRSIKENNMETLALLSLGWQTAALAASSSSTYSVSLSIGTAVLIVLPIAVMAASIRSHSIRRWWSMCGSRIAACWRQRRHSPQDDRNAPFLSLVNDGARSDETAMANFARRPPTVSKGPMSTERISAEACRPSSPS